MSLVRLACFPILATLLVTASLFGQDEANKLATDPAARKIKSADLLADLAVLRKAYEQLHPGLYRYNSKQEMDQKFEDLRTKFSRDLSLQEAYLAFSIFAAQVKCGHTYPNFFNQNKEIAAALFQGHDRLPFYFRWLDNQMIVLRDFTPQRQLPRGTRIISINSVPVEEILPRLLQIARADGANDAKRVAYLEVTGDSKYEAFDIYFPLFFPSKSTTLQLVIQRPGEKDPQALRVEALTFAQRLTPIQERESARIGGDEPLFDWKYLPDGNAYLRMPSWALYNTHWDWRTWLSSHLDELSEKNPSALIIDLRGNEGGIDVGNEILKRLVRTDLRIAAYQRLVRYRRVPNDLAPFLDTWDPSFKDWGNAATQLPEAWPTAPPVPYLRLKKYDDDAEGGDLIRPSGKPFYGKIFLLIDANNSSATFQFAQVVQQNKLGTLVGQPTGGNQRGINGGAFFFLRLPKSKIELDLPLIGTFPATPKADAGLTPDVPVQPTVEDILQGRDTELARVLSLLKS